METKMDTMETKTDMTKEIFNIAFSVLSITLSKSGDKLDIDQKTDICTTALRLLMHANDYRTLGYVYERCEGMKTKEDIMCFLAAGVNASAEYGEKAQERLSVLVELLSNSDQANSDRDSVKSTRREI